MAIVLGIHCGHNASAALFLDGRLTAAVSEERLNRVKNHLGFPYRAVDECLRLGGIHARDVTHVALSEAVFPWRFFEKPSAKIAVREAYHAARRGAKKMLMDLVGTRKVGKERLVGPFDYERILQRQGVASNYEKHFLSDKFKKTFDFRNAAVRFYPHHLSHAYSVYPFSGWPDALVVTVDGGGFGICHTVNVPGNGAGRLKTMHQTSEDHSPGFFYQDITVLLGFKALQHEGKITGLAAYGKPETLREPFTRCLHPTSDLNSFENEFPAVGDRRKFLQDQIRGHSREDVSSAAQEVLEAAIVPHIRKMVQETGRRKLALAGGVFANVKLNQRIIQLAEVEEIFVTPPMGDEGLAWGSAVAMMTLSDDCENPPLEKLKDVYLGPKYEESECEAALKAAGHRYERLEDKPLFDRAGAAIADGKIVGWYQGRMEFGPRALGNRSVLADPRKSETNDILNKRLSRSEFMPFAPSVLAEQAPEIFEKYEKAPFSAEFMTVTFDVKKSWHERVPAIVHVDGTARPQVVKKSVNPRYYGVIEAFYKKTGVPLVLNTSFNAHEEPIVCRPEEAVRALTEKRIDVLVLGNLISSVSGAV